MFDLIIPLPTFFILLGLLLALMAVWALQQKKGNGYNAMDLVMEGDPPRASLTKHIIIGCFALSVWLVIMRTLDHDNEIPPSVDGLLLGMLGVFVLNKVGSEAVYRFSRRPQAPAPIVGESQDVSVTVEPRSKKG